MLRTMSAGKRTGHEAFCGRSAAMVARRSQPGRGPRAGAGAALLLGMVALMMLLGVVAWMTLGSGDRSEEFGFANRSGAEATGAEDLPQVTVAEGPRAVSGLQAGPAGEYASMGRVFDGTGMILGEVQVDAGVPYPERWTLILDGVNANLIPRHAKSSREVSRTRNERPSIRASREKVRALSRILSR